MTKKKAMYIILDALRFDALENENFSSYLFPTLSKLAESGIATKVVTNAQSTQFVLPSLFSLTYPLDYGGYNTGIRERPASFVECIQKSNIKTLLMSTCNQMGVGTGYNRGFDEVLTTADFRLLIEQKISRTLLYEVKLYKKGEKSKTEVLRILNKEFSILLESLSDMINLQDKSLWPKKLIKINNKVGLGCDKEREILDKTPEIILNKILKVPAGVYWYTLGKTNYKSLSYYLLRIFVAFSWRFKRFTNNQTLWPYLVLGHYQVLFGQIIDSVCKKITELKDQSFFMHFHVMDIHDCRSINHIFHALSRYRYFPKWFYARLTGKTKRHFIYDSAIMYVDSCLKKICSHMKKERIFDDTLILLTADHGYSFAESPRKKSDVGTRTHYEDIEVPFVIVNGSKKSLNKDLCDSMGVTASFLDELNIKPDKSFKGVSIYKGGRKAIISENCGRGNADLKRRDIYFTVTTEYYKMMTVLKDSKLHHEKLFSLKEDPFELNNLIYDNNYKSVISILKKYLSKERSEIFKLRNISENNL